MQKTNGPDKSNDAITALPGIRRTQPRVVSQNLVNNTELTLMMPVKPGFIPSRDTVTYATRARLLMEAFHGFRQISREASSFHPFSDVVERISTIQSYRLALLEDDTKLLLAVSFDQPWEPYIRRIWRDTGPFLDSILCNCVGYEKHASENGFEAFASWVRNTQVESSFFYIADNLSTGDRTYLETIEQQQREGAAKDRDLKIARTRVQDAEVAAKETRDKDPNQTIATGLRALGVLYRLNDLFPDVKGSRDHVYYHHAVRRLLHGFDTSKVTGTTRDVTFKPELDWYEQHINPPKQAKKRKAPKNGEIQAGILRSYQGVSHGVFLMLRIKQAASAGKFIAALPITTYGNEPPTGSPSYNIAFTYNGLVQLQANPNDLAKLPQEFREGMAARAGMLGDILSNHPAKWNLPKRYVSPEQADAAANNPPPIQISSVDFVIQIRCSSAKTGYTTKWDKHHPLYDSVSDLMNLRGAAGVQLLSIQPMAHFREEDKENNGKIREHFGFLDGLSQPKVKEDPQHPEDNTWTNEAAMGDLFVGHGNSFGDPAYQTSERGSFVDNSTFLVVRKLQQNVKALNKLLPKDPKQRNERLGKMMGRYPDGSPVVKPKGSEQNDFTFKDDPVGDQCPLHAHARRANPREVTDVIGADRGGKIRPPRIIRRGMSYGPRFDADPAETDRGLMFMAYNASIAEQFEVVQRWLSGGNATGGYSGQSDPFLGVPIPGKQRTFRFVANGKVEHQPIDALKDADPLVKLEWGMYLFVPSMRTLRSLTKPVERPDLVARGEAIIAKLQRAESEATLDIKREPFEVSAEQQWKAVLEDVQSLRDENSDALWAAVRASHGGVLSTPYGVLVGTEKHARTVLKDDGKQFSVREYWWRLRNSFGDIYLSMDPNPIKFPGKTDPTQPPGQKPYHSQVKCGEYQDRSKDINTLINSFSEAWAFEHTYQITRAYLGQIIELHKGVQGNLRIRGLVDRVLGELSAAWFGIPDDNTILKAGEPTVREPNTLHCPFHFVASSRFAFSPNPEPAAIAEGQDHGMRLQQATEKWVRALGADPAKNDTPLGGPMFELLGHNPPQLASELIGVMHGFLPSTLGNLLKAMAVWIDDGNLWRMQDDYLADANQDKFERANDTLRDPLMRVMQYRPVPEHLHRLVVARDLKLGKVALSPGDKVVIGIGSVSSELLDKGQTDVSWIFGGNYYGTKTRGKNIGTHGCPGQKIAMGVLLGVTAALLESGPLHAEPASLILTLS